MEIGLIAKKALMAKPEALSLNRKFGQMDPVQYGVRPNRVRFVPTAGSRKRTGRAVGLRNAVRSELKIEEKSDESIKSDKVDPAPAQIFTEKVDPAAAQIFTEKVDPAPVQIFTAKVDPAPVQLFVGLPLDCVSNCKNLNHTKAISVGLRALKLLGVHGVELPISWGVAVDGGWPSYLAVAEMVREAGLQLRVSLHLYASTSPCLPFPEFVANAVANDPDLLFMDRSGRRKTGCLSFAADELPVLNGKKPVEAFKEFFQSFRSEFSHLIGNTVTNITIGLGPNGELRYPSFPQSSDSSLTGVGEFQCYDKYMLADLKQHAEGSVNKFWGLSGPHDTPEYSQSPDFGNFFKETRGSWETPYGEFFLSWYSEKLLSHANCLLSIGSKVFGDLPVTLSSKLPLLHCWHNIRSRPAQLTAGFFNTENRDGYDAVANIFARNSCAMIISGMDLADAEQPQSAQSSPESLLSQIRKACEKNGVKVHGENSSVVGTESVGFGRIKENILSENSAVESFTYHRMGAEFFSPDHWPRFTEFVRSTTRIELGSDNLPSNEEKVSLNMHSELVNSVEMQTA